MTEENQWELKEKKNPSDAELFLMALIFALVFIAILWLNDNGWQFRLDAKPPLPYDVCPVQQPDNATCSG